MLHIISDEILQTSLFGVNGSTDYASDNLITHTQVDPFLNECGNILYPLMFNEQTDRQIVHCTTQSVDPFVQMCEGPLNPTSNG